MKKKNILIITYTIPYPLRSGGHQAVFNMIDNLRDKFNIILLYKKKKDQKEAETILKGKWPEVKFYSYKKTIQNQLKWNKHFLDKIYNIFLNIIFRKSIQAVFFNLLKKPKYDEAFLNLINEIVYKEHIDIVQTEFFENLFLVYNLPESVLKVFIHHEIRYIRNERSFLQLKNKINSLIKFEYNSLKNEEIAALNRYDAVVTLSEIDKNLLTKDGVKVPILISPALVQSICSSLAEFNFNNQLVFLGGANHIPNYEGLMWFLSNIWSNISIKYPSLTLKVVGIWSKKNIHQICSEYKNIEFTGFIPDLASVLRNSIMVVPILIGSGIRMKIIEAANHGCPFISTKIGIEGLSFKDNIDCFIEDDAATFNQKLEKLIKDPDIQNCFRKNAFKVVQENYSKEKLIKSRIEVYKFLS